jgi:glucose-1-phosphate cytidylyltransferase
MKGDFVPASVVDKLVILAGGLGTRLSEETEVRPKPLVEIGGRPIIWHLMKIYSHYGIHKFIVCVGYKGYLLKEYFANYYLHSADVTFDIASNSAQYHNGRAEAWSVTLIETGTDTMTGGRLKRIRDYVGDDIFCMTYCDGLADIDIGELIAFHRRSERKATITAVRPPGRFGALDVEGSKVRGFQEKPRGDGGWINGGFFVLCPSVLDLIEGDHTVWELDPLQTLARNGDLAAFHHDGFWQPMDTLRDKHQLEALWNSGKAPWKVW